MAVTISANWQGILAGDIIPGDTAWMLMSTALVFIMTPGLGFFYSGLARTKNALSILLACLLCMAIVSMQWFFFGYSLAFSETSGNNFIGDFNNGALGNLRTTHPVAPTIPTTVFVMYELMFAAITPALAIGASAERMRIAPMMVFFFLWTTFAYDFFAYWIWSANGWGHVWGVLDYAGGSVVHVSSGTAAIALAIMCGPRVGHNKLAYGPHNLSYVYLGTALLWFGWLGFNGGSALAANERAGFAIVTSHIAASFGGFTWMVLEHFVHRKNEWSAAGFCAGAIAGLATVTPGCGYITPSVSLIYGIGGTAACFFVANAAPKLRFDDALGVFATHGVGGIIGMLLTGIFAQDWITALDSTSSAAVQAGWIDRVWIQLGRQVAAIAAIGLWSFVITIMICWVLDRIPHMHLVATLEEEKKGLDIADLGEVAYEFLLQETPIEKHSTSMNRTGNTGLPAGYTNTYNNDSEITNVKDTHYNEDDNSTIASPNVSDKDKNDIEMGTSNTTSATV